MEEKRLDEYHEGGLEEEGGREALFYPVEELESGGDEHNERDVEREARGGPRAVDGMDLVGVGCDG